MTAVGVRLPSHLTASGRALLATLPKEQVRALFPDASAFATRGESVTKDPVHSYSRLTRILEEVRERGYAAEDEDVTHGVASLAIAVRDHAGWPAACITVTFPKQNVPYENWAALAEEIRYYAAELSRRIRGSS